ncbi:RNA 2',3'-cyclic phosphodiesterase [candidate division KSB1 bacterium]|nr:RNA 2',3'-cyclic phosphodiesterase [candidate division KSB1 bacterium]RQW05148.1 MAG: RNA 2',3'-cyclic phosphodiesterase [candidate division KSB1 bacterium]
MAKIRTFICFELPDAVRQSLAQLQDNLKRHGKGVRWVRPAGIHLTLKFLGDVDEKQLPDIVSVVRKASEPYAPIKIHLYGTGAFPNLHQPKVYWIGVEEAADLIKIQSDLENELAPLGFPKEKRQFSPHLTLGRVKSSDGLKAITAALEKEALPRMSFTANEIIVMQSQLAPGGAVYSALANIALKKN